MKKLLAMAVLALGVMIQPVMAQNDAKAKAILDAASKKVSSLKSVKANFALSLNANGGKMKDTKKGTFIMKGQKYRVSLGPQEIICDGKTVWTYSKDANEVQVNNFNASEQTLSPAKLFTNFYDKEYRYKYAGSRTVNGKACDVVELTPATGGKQFSKIELAVDKSSTIVGGNVWEKNGTQYKYDISGFTPNPPVTDAQFVFDPKKYPGVEVVDMR
jgi:outer membrane lipoprotein carrier protein